MKVLIQKLEEQVAALAEERSKLDLIANNMPIGAILLNNQGSPLLINTRASSIAGYQYSAKDKVLEGLFARFKKYSLEDHLKKCISGEPSRIEEAETQGLVFEFQFHCLPAPGDQKFYGHIIWIREVTAEKMLERARDEFFILASHELRTPLTAIRWNASLMERFFGKEIKDQDIQDMVRDISEASVRLIKIVNDFLLLSRLEQRKVLFKFEQFDLGELVRSVIRETEKLAVDKKIYLNFKLPEETNFEVKGDRERTREVLLNLISNALSYTREGGVLIELNKKGKFLEVLVVDTGAGIAFKNQQYLFRKFQQAGDRILSREVSQGTGLGLYLSKMLIEAMGGEIELLKSEEGKGSTFRFTLPAALG